MKPSTSKTILSKGEGEAIPAIPSTRCRCEDTRREDSNEQCDFCTQQAKRISGDKSLPLRPPSEMSKNKFHENDTALIINKREQLWEQQKKLLVEQNETLLLMIADKERKWEMEKAEMLQRNMELTNALEESERKAKAQHKALTERCEVLIAALETKYAEEKLLHSQRVLDSVTSERININVGGKVFSTCRETLTRNNFRLERWPIHSDGSYFVDRDPTYFSAIMAYMRTGHLDAENLTDKQRRRLRAEFIYYQLPLPILKQSFQWSSERIGGGLTLSNNNKTVSKNTRNVWKGVIGSLPVDSFSVRVEDRGSMGLLMIGFGKKENFRSNDPNYKFSGWFLYILDGTLWSPEEKVHSKPFHTEDISDGCVVTATFNRMSRSISFHVDNDSPVVAFDCSNSLSELDELYPVMDIFDAPVTLSAVFRS